MAAGPQECLICMENCKSPKLLPCRHSFCYTSLDDYIRVNLKNGEYNCPVCRESVELRMERVSGFQTKVDIDTNSCDKITCDLCGVNSYANSRCLDCEENLCHSCCHAHEKSKVSKHHKIRDLGTLDPETKGKIRMRTFCEQHSEEEIKLVCQNCNVLICILCKAVNHENHVTKTLADAADEVKKNLQAKMNSCNDKLKRLDAAAQKGKELCRRISDAEQEEIKTVEHQHSQLLKILDKEVEKLKCKIANVYRELIKENTVSEADLQKETKTCLSANQNAQTLIDKGTHIEIIKKGPDHEQSISKAISMTDPTPPPSLKKKYFMPTEMEPSVLISLLGIMKDITTPQQQHLTYPQAVIVHDQDPLTSHMLASAPAQEQKHMLAGGFQNVPAGPQVRPARPKGTAQTNMRPAMYGRSITGQNTTQPRANMPVTQSNVPERAANASVPRQQQPRPYKLPQRPPRRNVPQAQKQQNPPQSVVAQVVEPLTSHMLASAPPQEQKQMLGERLFPRIQRMYPDLAAKITGMLLGIDNSELLHMLKSSESLKAKVDEAVAVLQAHQAREGLLLRYH